MIYVIMVANVESDCEKDIQYANDVAFVGTSVEKAYECYLDIVDKFEYMEIGVYEDNAKSSLHGIGVWLWNLLQVVEYNEGDNYTRPLTIEDFERLDQDRIRLGQDCMKTMLHNKTPISKLDTENSGRYQDRCHQCKADRLLMESKSAQTNFNFDDLLQ